MKKGYKTYSYTVHLVRGWGRKELILLFQSFLSVSSIIIRYYIRIVKQIKSNNSVAWGGVACAG